MDKENDAATIWLLQSEYTEANEAIYLIVLDHQPSFAGIALPLATVDSLICFCVNSAEPSWHLWYLGKNLISKLRGRVSHLPSEVACEDIR